MNITFVSAFIDLKENRPNEKTHNNYIELFKKLASSKIQLASFIYEMEKICKEYDNVKIIKILNLEDTWTYSVTKNRDVTLPELRHSTKDTKNYMITMNTKMEYIKIAIDANIFNTEYFAWIDFGICHVFKNPDETLQYLYNLSQCTFDKEFFAIPGGWNNPVSPEVVFNIVSWRFCGGFFLGDKHTMIKTWKLFKHSYKNYIEKYNRVTWELNIWAYMEYVDNWKPIWYHSYHDDSIIKIPQSLIKNN
jgi:hypothetical protein